MKKKTKNKKQKKTTTKNTLIMESQPYLPPDKKKQTCCGKANKFLNNLVPFIHISTPKRKVSLTKINNNNNNNKEKDIVKTCVDQKCIIGIRYDFPFINIRKVPREVLKTEGEARCFQHLPRDLANVN